jgi:hypothetical protein
LSAIFNNVNIINFVYNDLDKDGTVDNSEIISIRVSPEMKELLKKAAALKQQSIADYAIPILKKQADTDIYDLETTYGPLLKTLGIASLITLPFALINPVAVAIASAATITSAIRVSKKP